MIVVDTHAWIWWVSEPARLGKAARRALDAAKRVGVPSMCCLEVAMLERRGRLRLDRPTLEWLHDALADSRVEVLALTPAVAVRAADLPDSFPGDPADRVITASALVESASLITKDEGIRRSGLLATVW